MTMDASGTAPRAILLVGASRGLGLAIAREFVKKGWHVVGTVQGEDHTELHDLADQHPGLVEIQSLDITVQDQIAALRDGLAGRQFDILFNNAGTANRKQGETIADVSTEEFIRVMVTNALSPMRVLETLQDFVPPTGLLGIMSSGQGSISGNTRGGHEVYRGTKSALNQYMRSFAARHADDPRALVLIAPGWVRTDLGGPDAPLSVEESIPKVVEVLLAQFGKSGLQYLDRDGKTVPW